MRKLFAAAAVAVLVSSAALANDTNMPVGNNQQFTVSFCNANSEGGVVVAHSTTGNVLIADDAGTSAFLGGICALVPTGLKPTLWVHVYQAGFTKRWDAAAAY